ncbi:MAG TPA: hypothetical protein VIF15_00605 [Polyangiaceae bacterium]|jgi:hypothetical protein
MSTADVTREDAPPPEDHRAQPASRSRVPPSSPGLAAGWLLRTAALAAFAAGALGVIVAPGIHGNASERVVNWVDGASGTVAVFLLIALLGLIFWGAVELVREQGVESVARFALVGGGTGAVAIVMVGMVLRDRHTDIAVYTAATTAVTVFAGAYASARAPHTRAVAAVLVAFGFAAVARLAAWELAMQASDRASVQLYGVSRGLATAGVVFEAMGQLVAVTWLGTRSKLAGQVGSTLALVAAFAVTWGVARGVHSEAAPWQSMLHTALADAPGVPPPYGLDAVATFLVPASLLLALVSASQPRQVAVVVATVALALVSRGAFDAPLRALCAVAAAQWAVLARADERAMWRTLIDDRNRKLAEDAPPPERRA